MKKMILKVEKWISFTGPMLKGKPLLNYDIGNYLLWILIKIGLFHRLLEKDIYILNEIMDKLELKDHKARKSKIEKYLFTNCWASWREFHFKHNSDQLSIEYNTDSITDELALKRGVIILYAHGQAINLLWFTKLIQSNKFTALGNLSADKLKLNGQNQIIQSEAAFEGNKKLSRIQQIRNIKNGLRGGGEVALIALDGNEINHQAIKASILFNWMKLMEKNTSIYVLSNYFDRNSKFISNYTKIDFEDSKELQERIKQHYIMYYSKNFEELNLFGINRFNSIL